jgi:hypothetical protein
MSELIAELFLREKDELKELLLIRCQTARNFDPGSASNVDPVRRLSR